MKRILIAGTPFALYQNPVWLKDYRDTPCGRGHLEVTDNASEAKTFVDMTTAIEFWQQTSRTHPMRPDGKPNRPLTAYTVEIVNAE